MRINLLKKCLILLATTIKNKHKVQNESSQSYIDKKILKPFVPFVVKNTTGG